jgi:hypothetical protein
MQNAQSLKVYCSDIQCGMESLSASGPVPIRTRRHRRMSYTGRRRVGLTSLAVLSALNPGASLEVGTYHFYSCPVCGQESTYVENRVGMHRVE